MIKRVHQLSHKRLMQFPQKTVTNIFCPKMMFSLSKLTKIKGFLFTNFHKVGSGKKNKKNPLLCYRDKTFGGVHCMVYLPKPFFIYIFESVYPLKSPILTYFFCWISTHHANITTVLSTYVHILYRQYWGQILQVSTKHGVWPTGGLWIRFLWDTFRSLRSFVDISKV